MEILPMGVFYRRSDGAEVNLTAGEQWLIDLKPEGGVLLRRFLDGVIDEAVLIHEQGGLGSSLFHCEHVLRADQ